MPKPNQLGRPFRVTSVIASLTAGGIGPVCRYAAEGMAKQTDWQVTLLSLHDPAGEFADENSGLRIVCLGLDGNCARLFLDWLAAHPQDLVITSGVSRIEPAYLFIPPATCHIEQIHDSKKRYQAVAVQHAACLDGVVCVAHHIEHALSGSLQQAGYHGMLGTVHNGASFPPPPERTRNSGPLRLLFMGSMDPFKGIFDLVPILEQLNKMKVPAHLTIAGGQHALLASRFKKKKLEHLVTWTGRVPHEECYRLAAESDIFLMPSRKEPFGMVTIEAMSMGCVPIAYDVPSGSTEIIKNGKSGLLVPFGDFGAWTKLIYSLHHERERLAELSNEAIARARESFNAEKMSKTLVAFLVKAYEHCKTHPAKRESGLPPASPEVYAQPVSGYQMLPSRLRYWIRNQVGSRPRLAYWLLNR
jgi:glycosyltransferase involved in cell wall biosynthesis